MFGSPQMQTEPPLRRRNATAMKQTWSNMRVLKLLLGRLTQPLPEMSFLTGQRATHIVLTCFDQFPGCLSCSSSTWPAAQLMPWALEDKENGKCICPEGTFIGGEDQQCKDFYGAHLFPKRHQGVAVGWERYLPWMVSAYDFKCSRPAQSTRQNISLPFPSFISDISDKPNNELYIPYIYTPYIYICIYTIYIYIYHIYMYIPYIYIYIYIPYIFMYHIYIYTIYMYMPYIYIYIYICIYHIYLYTIYMYIPYISYIPFIFIYHIYIYHIYVYTIYISNIPCIFIYHIYIYHIYVYTIYMYIPYISYIPCILIYHIYIYIYIHMTKIIWISLTRFPFGVGRDLIPDRGWSLGCAPVLPMRCVQEWEPVLDARRCV